MSPVPISSCELSRKLSLAEARADQADPPCIASVPHPSSIDFAVCKPYNSVLGEHFRCHWEVPPNSVDPATREPVINGFLHQHNVGDPQISGYNTPGNTSSTRLDKADASSVA